MQDVLTAIVPDGVTLLFMVPAVLLFGIAKGGFGGSIALLSVPLISVVMSPIQAAAVMLPILCVMDVVVIWSYRRNFHAQTLKIVLPGALVGVLLGYLTAGYMNDNAMRLLIGGLAILFVVQAWTGISIGTGREHHRGAGTTLGAMAGFTSFAIHAGGPPYAMYALPKRMDPPLYAGTAGIFFFVVNYVKLVPYYALGQLSVENLSTSLVLMPLAPVGVLMGVWLAKRINKEVFYNVCYFFLLVVGVKLLLEGLGWLKL